MICMVKNLPTANFILRGKSEKYTKENMLVEHFGSHFSQNGPFNLISWPHCHIFNTLSIDTHIVYSYGHMAIWLYGHMAIIWPYGYTAIWLYGSECLVIWVSMERALKMWQCGQEIKLKGPFCEKWEPKCSTSIFSFVYFGDFPLRIKLAVGSFFTIKTI